MPSVLILLYIRDAIGDCAVAGDLRWAGAFGVNVDFVARSHCSVAVIAVADVLVREITPLASKEILV